METFGKSSIFLGYSSTEPKKNIIYNNIYNDVLSKAGSLITFLNSLNYPTGLILLEGFENIEKLQLITEIYSQWNFVNIVAKTKLGATKFRVQSDNLLNIEGRLNSESNWESLILPNIPPDWTEKTTKLMIGLISWLANPAESRFILEKYPRILTYCLPFQTFLLSKDLNFYWGHLMVVPYAPNQVMIIIQRKDEMKPHLWSDRTIELLQKHQKIMETISYFTVGYTEFYHKAFVKPDYNSNYLKWTVGKIAEKTGKDFKLSYSILTSLYFGI